MLPKTSKGIAYLPDGSAGLSVEQTPRTLRHVVSIFLLVFVFLQWGWSAARDTWLERVVIHHATVATAVALIRLGTPEIPAQAAGASIKAPGGGLNILNGCEGTEVMFLLVAAFVAVRLHWRHRAAGLAFGLAFVFILNQARILALFYAFRADRALFDALHTAVLPVILIALSAAYFYAFLHDRRHRMA